MLTNNRRYGHMRILIGICILVVCLIPYYLYKIRVVSLGYRYCDQVDKLIDLYHDCHIPEQKDTKFVKRKISDVEYLIELTNQLYELLKSKERHFRGDDWYKITIAHDKIEKLKNDIRYQKWLHQIL